MWYRTRYWFQNQYSRGHTSFAPGRMIRYKPVASALAIEDVALAQPRRLLWLHSLRSEFAAPP